MNPTTTSPGTRVPFRPAPGLGNPHVQTIAGKFLRPATQPVHLVRERVETPDGDFLDLDFVSTPGSTFDSMAAHPVVVVLHGLEGAASRRYMLNTYRALLERGLRALGLNFRGCSGEPNRTSRAYHSGETEDLRFVLQVVRERFGGPTGLVGYSLGGNVALKLLGEEGLKSHSEDSLVAAGAVVSVPFDLAAGADRISEGIMGRVYSTYFLRNLRRKLRLKADLLRDLCEFEAAVRARTLREFDQSATAPLHDFDSASDYYARSSSNQFIESIRVPTLIIHSEDDPFLPVDRIPADAIASNPRVEALITERGGHVGFIAGSLAKPRFWAEETLADFLQSRLI